MLSRLQQATTFMLLLSVLCWVGWWLHHDAPLPALLGAVAILFLHAPVLAAEFILSAWANRRDPTPQASAGQLVRAWFAEILTTPAIFCWRQPFASQAEPDHLPPKARGRRGVVFVHGFVCNRGFWTPWLKPLRRAGTPFVAVNLEPVFGGMDDYIPELEQAVFRLEAATGRPPVLICHSMGGLVARAWLARAGNSVRVDHVITIGTPHHGTWLSRFARARNARQMLPGCAWLGELAVREAATPSLRAPMTCWYSNADNIVFPASTATLRGADNRHLPGVAHVSLAFDPRVVHHAMGVVASQ